MKVYGINLCNINVYAREKKKNSVNIQNQPDNFVRKKDIAFGSSDVDYYKKLDKLFTNPKHQELFADAYMRIKAPLLKSECVDNEYKLKFINYVLSKDIKADSPIITEVGLNNPETFISFYENIDSEESLDAKKSALDFLLKHPDYTISASSYDRMFGDCSGPKILLHFMKNKYAKDFLMHIDSNYEKFMSTQLLGDLGKICAGISSEEKAKVCKDIFDFCCKNKYYDSSICTYLSAVQNDYGAKYIKTILPKAYSKKTEGDHLNTEFLDWYFIIGINTEKKYNTAVELYEKTVENPETQHRFALGFRELGEMIHYNENITTDELIGIDKTFQKLPNPICYDFRNKLLEILEKQPTTWKKDINEWLDSTQESIDWYYKMYPESYPNEFHPEF